MIGRKLAFNSSLFICALFVVIAYVLSITLVNAKSIEVRCQIISPFALW